MEEYIPFDIVKLILLRSPAESLLRFRTMSKLYRETIDDPDFARTQYSLVGHKDPNLLFRFDWYGNLHQLQVDGELLRPRPGPRPRPISRPWAIHCSTNGFLLFAIGSPSSQAHKIVLCNPLRRESIVLEPPPKPEGRGLESWTNRYALAFDRSMKEYMIVCLFTQYIFQVKGAAVYSSKTKLWKKTKNIPPGLVYDPPVFLNASIYWVCYHDGDDGLVSFDFETDEFGFHSKIDLPDYIITAGLIELGGYLVLGDNSGVRGCRRLRDAWTLIENEWKRMDVIDIDKQPLDESYYFMACYRSFYYLNSDGLKLRSSKKFIQFAKTSMLELDVYRCKRTLVSVNDF